MRLRDFFPWTARKDDARPASPSSGEPGGWKVGSRKALLVGAAAVSLAAAVGWAALAIDKTHWLDVRLADGTHAQILYVGDNPPTVSFGPAQIGPEAILAPHGLLGLAPEFAALDRASQMMARQADLGLQRVGGETARDRFDIGALPPDVQGVSVVSTLTDRGVCTRTVQIRSTGAGKPPQFVARNSGACPVDEAAPNAATHVRRDGEQDRAAGMERRT